MSLRRARHSENLYLLLDTMCNYFGALILIAVVLAMINKTQHDSAATGAGTAEELLKRRLANAETAVDAEQKYCEGLRSVANDPDFQTRLKLLQEQAQLRRATDETAERLRARELASRDDRSKSPTERLKELEEKTRQAVAHQDELENARKTGETEIARLQRRLADLGAQTVKLQAQSVQTLRFPHERATAQSPFNIILQYGRLYPVQNARLELNTTGLQVEHRGNSVLVRPIQGAGIDVKQQAAELRNFLSQLPRTDVYVAFYVYDDSFDTFILAREITARAGLDLGWSPTRSSDGPLVFGATGTRPQVQH